MQVRIHIWTRFFIRILIRQLVIFVGEIIRAAVINWEAGEESELDERISQMIADVLSVKG